MDSLMKGMLALPVLPLALLLWGFVNGVVDVRSERHNMLTLAQRTVSMNLISMEGYKAGLETSSEFMQRRDGYSELLKKVDSCQE